MSIHNILSKRQSPNNYLQEVDPDTHVQMGSYCVNICQDGGAGWSCGFSNCMNDAFQNFALSCRRSEFCIFSVTLCTSLFKVLML